jgi:D-alanine-D-alanine ligase
LDVLLFDPAERPIWDLLSLGVNKVFIALHGRMGEDGSVQGALDCMHIPYTGSGVMASALCMDKLRSKMIWQSVGVPTAKWCTMTSVSEVEAVVAALGLPVFVKPPHEGSSLGIRKATTEAELVAAFVHAKQFDEEILVEQQVVGREFSITVLDGEVLPIVEIIAPEGRYDYDNKYFTDEVKYECPARLDSALSKKMQADTARVFAALGVTAWGRADVMLRADGSYEFLEVNTAPGMTSHSLVPIAARAKGLDFPSLCKTILDLADCCHSSKDNSKGGRST